MTARSILKAAVALAVTKLQRRLTKSVDGYVNSYVATLSEVVTDVLNGDGSWVDVSGTLRRLIDGESEGAYIQGMIESGEFKTESEAQDALTDGDRDAIDEWKRVQKESVKDFSLAVEEAARPLADGSPNTSAQQAILNRVELWGLSLRDLASTGKTNALLNSKDPFVTWKLGKTEVHCQSEGGKMGCAQLDGKRQRLSKFIADGHIPQQNASQTLTCGGWRCECELRDDRGKVILPA